MAIIPVQHILFRSAAILLIGTAVFVSGSSDARAQIDMSKKPVLVITNDPMPASSSNPMYSRPSKAPEITAEQVAGAGYFEPAETIVGRKIDELRTDLFSLETRVGTLSEQLRSIENRGQSQAAEYHASVATINTQLQSGTTPGNPRLVQKLTTAQMNLDTLTQSIADLNTMAVEIANTASMGSFLLESVRSTYGLSGAIEEDHARLSQMEDQINNIVVSIDRLLNDVNDDITRTASYLGSERNNLRTLSLAISNGDLYGKSLANMTFQASRGDMMQPASYQPPMQQVPAERRPLAKIRFDKADVNFEQPVYMAVSEAMERYPQASFDIVAVHPNTGNAAQVAIESTRARRNAEKVLRSLAQMGLPTERMNLSYTASPEARTSEVHIFIQ